MISSSLSEIVMLGADFQWFSLTHGTHHFLVHIVSNGLAPGPETLLLPFEKGMRFLHHQWLTLSLVPYSLCITTVAFIVILSKFPSKANNV